MQQSTRLAGPRLDSARLKELGSGIKVGRVLGTRVLVKPVTPFTEMDRLEKEGLLYAPKHVKEELTPRPTTGVVVAVGQRVTLVSEGDMVMFSKFAGMDFLIEEEQLRIVHVDD